MLKKIYSLLGTVVAAALFSNSALLAQEASDGMPPAEVSGSVEAEMVAPVEVSEQELIELVGYLTAMGGGISSLQLDAESVAALAGGLKKGLKGELDVMALPREEIEAAFEQAQARAEAIESGAEEIPAVELEALEKIGMVILAQTGLTQLGFGPEQADLIEKGFIKGAQETEMDPAMEAKMPAFQEFIQARVERSQAAMMAESAGAAEANIAAGKAFIESLKESEAELESSESGLFYTIHEAGGDVTPSLSDSVLVHYKGTRIDGTVFDSSYDRGEPAEFPLNGVVPGFGEGLTKIGEGGKITLYIPSELAYGNNPRPGGAIQPGDMLIFECELIEIR